MRIKHASLLFGASLLLSGIGAISAYSMLQPAQSLEDKNCNSCHLGENRTQIAADPILHAAEEILCSNCHADALMASHPSGVTPSMAVPENFPLDWKGDMTCSTCHEIHNQNHGTLRTDNLGAPFCGSCHPADFFTNMADEGMSTIISGHLDASGVLEDPYSIQCMICHDDKDAPNQALPVSVSNQGILRHQGGSHPIGSAYTQATSYGGYRPISQLHEDIALPNGLVSCISCHLSYSENHGQLVTSNENSALCFQCHLM